MKKNILSTIKAVAKNKIFVVQLLLFVGIVCMAVILLVSVNKTVTAGKSNKEIPIYCVDTQTKKVALSFDAAWGNEDTKVIIGILDKYDVKVTFFMTGGWVEKYPLDVKLIASAGHDLANHSENHKEMSKLSHDGCVDEIMKVHNKVETLTGQSMCLFRPPYGDYNDNLIKSAEECGYYTIQWSVDTLYIKVMTF